MSKQNILIFVFLLALVASAWAWRLSPSNEVRAQGLWAMVAAVIAAVIAVVIALPE